MQLTDLAQARRDTAVVFLAHQWNEAIGRRFARLWRESASLADCFVLLQDDGGDVVRMWRTWMASIGASDRLMLFSDIELPAKLGYSYSCMLRIMANAHFPVMLFARARRYAYYWQVESDVEYRGRWQPFFEAYRDTDASLLASHFHGIAEWPQWQWWPSLRLPPGVRIEVDQLCKAFMAVVRFSRAALDTIEEAHRNGWNGHFETMIPTALQLAGHRLEDLNVRTSCYQGVFQDPCPLIAVQSTVRWRPFVSQHEFCHRGQGPLMFHPIKDAWSFDGEKVVANVPEPAPT